MKSEFWIRGAVGTETAPNAPLTNVFNTSRALYFQMHGGISARLTYEGIKGWRLQANTINDVTFAHPGASQSLSSFLGEPHKDCTEELTVIKEKNTLRAICRQGSSVELSLSPPFSLKTVSKDGRIKTELCAIFANETGLTMESILEAEEAVFGGGERFDAVNRRGTETELYSCDGWNNTSTTYAPIPLFFTSRGGGMFVNLYDTAIADFGKKSPDRWSYTVKRTVMDCSFYPSEDPKEVLLGYTELSGHAYLPAPWMQGMHICRYGPDFHEFDIDFSKDSIEEFDDWEQLFILAGDTYIPFKDADENTRAFADRFYLPTGDGAYALSYVRDDTGKYYKKGPKNSPGGNSVKTIMESFIRADLKPDAASMENLAWWQAFAEKKPELYNRSRLVNSVNWLHTHGLRAMVYIACGRGAILEHPEFREDFLLHADVELKNADGSVTRHENTTAIPWVVGTGENPDVWRSGDGRYRAEKYLDITNEEALAWYFDQIWGEMIRIGVDGVKIDFCEEMPDHGRLCGSATTYYRWKDPSKIVPGTEHHAYPTYFISAFYKRMLEHQQRLGLGDGFMVFSRGGGIGAQRSPYMWAGDQARDYAKLKDQLLAVINSGLSGIPFMSYDMAGYQYWGTSYHTVGKENESAIFARAVEFTALTTNMQTHGDVRHAYEMTEEVQEIYRNFTHLHKELIPYIQKYSEIACKTGIPPVRHPVLKYFKDPNVFDLSDEFLLGDALLVAPILTENTTQREVYLPAGSWTDLLTGEAVTGGQTVRVHANLGQLPLFLDNGSPDASELMPIFAGLTWHRIKAFGQASPDKR